MGKHQVPTAKGFPMKKPFNWKLFFILLAAAMSGAEAIANELIDKRLV